MIFAASDWICADVFEHLAATTSRRAAGNYFRSFLGNYHQRDALIING